MTKDKTMTQETKLKAIIKKAVKERGKKRIYDIEELLEVLIIVNLWELGLTQEQMREVLRIDISSISRTAKKLNKFKKEKKYG